MACRPRCLCPLQKLTAFPLLILISFINYLSVSKQKSLNNVSFFVTFGLSLHCMIFKDFLFSARNLIIIHLKELTCVIILIILNYLILPVSMVLLCLILDFL